MDQLLRLDSLLAKLFKEVDQGVGLANTLIVLSADHGAMPLVENLQRQGIAARRASPKLLEDAVVKAFERHFPGVEGLIAYFATDIYLDEAVMRLNHLDRRTVEKTAIDALMSTGLVEKIYTHSDLSGPSSEDAQLRLFQNAFFQPRSRTSASWSRNTCTSAPCRAERDTARLMTTIGTSRSSSWVAISRQACITRSVGRKTSLQRSRICSASPFLANITHDCYRKC